MFCDHKNVYLKFTGSGDPHITTFDGLYYHYMGHASYDYVAPCIANDRSSETGLPVTVTGEHIPSIRRGVSVSTIKFVFVTLYDSHGDEQYIIKLGQDLFAQFEYPGPLVGTDVTLNETYVFDASMGWEFKVDVATEDTREIQLKANFYQNDTGHNPEILVRYRWPVMKIWLSNCFFGQSCGLCGTWDSDPDNDLEIFNVTTQSFRVLVPNWDNYHLFGNEWCNPFISQLQTSGGDSNCAEDASVDGIQEPEQSCQDFSLDYCQTVWNVHCRSICRGNDNFGFEDWIRDCQLDSCGLTGNALVDMTYVEARTQGVFEQPIGVYLPCSADFFVRVFYLGVISIVF